MKTEKRKKIIYILGAGRSGTTLLDIVLGNGKNIASRGEINRFPKRNGVPPGCSVFTENFKYWFTVRNRLTLINPDYKDLKWMYDLHQKFEYHSYIFKGIRNSNKGDLAKYRLFIKRLYDVIFKTTAESTIVESSKYPCRALMLAEILDDVEICYLYVQRNPISVVNAFMKKNIEQPSKSWLSANVYYFFVNVLCNYTMMKLRGKHMVLKIKYEDLIKSPEKVLADIEIAFDLDLSGVKEKIRCEQSLTVGRLFDGNRIRLERNIIFQKKEINYVSSPKNIFTRTFNYLIYR